MRYFYRKKRALMRTFDDLDKKPVSNKTSTARDKACLTKTTDNTSLKETLMCLMFTGFEHSMKCPFSKIYSDINHLYPCYFPDDQCRNGRYNSLDTLLQHVQSKHCMYHKALGKYIHNFKEDKYEEQCVMATTNEKATSKK